MEAFPDELGPDILPVGRTWQYLQEFFFRFPKHPQGPNTLKLEVEKMTCFLRRSAAEKRKILEKNKNERLRSVKKRGESSYVLA